MSMGSFYLLFKNYDLCIHVCVNTHTTLCVQRPEGHAVGMVLSFYLYGASWQETQDRRLDHPALYSLSHPTTPISCTFSDFFHECGMSWWQIWVVVWTVARIKLHDKGQLRPMPRLRLCWVQTSLGFYLCPENVLGYLDSRSLYSSTNRLLKLVSPGQGDMFVAV